MRMILRGFALRNIAPMACVGLFLGACASRHAPPPTLPADSAAVAPAVPTSDKTDSPNRVAPGFQFRLSHAEDRTLNGTYRVAFDGRLRLPYDKIVETSGLDVEALAARVTELYKPFFKDGPQAKLVLTERKYWIDVGGLVNKAGRFLVDEATTIDEVVALAGSFLPQKSAEWVRIEQPNGNAQVINIAKYYQTGDRSPFPKWRGGDRVFFQAEEGDASASRPESDKGVRVLGQVLRPSEFLYRDGADFFHYLSQAGGPNQFADLRSVQLVRGSDNDRRIYHFDVERVAEIPPVRRGDILIVDPDRRSYFEKNLGYAVSFATILSAIAFVAIAAGAGR